MHKNYNSCLHILDMHVERGRHQFSHRKQILVYNGHLFRLQQGSHGQGKVRGKFKKFKVREKSGNFVFGQGNLKFWQKSGKSQGILESKVRPYFSVMIITVLNQ